MNKRVLICSMLAIMSSSVVAASADRLAKPAGVVGSVQTHVPTVITAGNILIDPSLEATDPNTFANPNWTSTSTSFGTGICNNAACGTGGGVSPPRTGNFWFWGGGTPTPEITTLSQTVVIPNGGPRFLNFYLRIGTVTAPFTATLQVQVDGVTLQTITEPSVAQAAYSRVSVDISAYANGAAHTVGFVYTNPAGSTDTSSFVIDDITLEIDTPVSLQSFNVE